MQRQLDLRGLRARLLLLSGTGILALALVSLIGIKGFRDGGSVIQEIGRERLPAISALHALERAQAAQIARTFEVALYENDYSARARFEAINRAKLQLDEEEEDAWLAYRALEKSAGDASSWEQFSAARNRWREIDQEIHDLIGLLALGPPPEQQRALFGLYAALAGDLRTHFDENRRLLRNIATLHAERVEAATRRAGDEAGFWQSVLLYLGLAAAAVLLLIDGLVAVSTLRQVGGDPRDAARVADLVAQGRLDTPIELRPGDRASLMRSLQVMVDKLRAMFDALRQAQATAERASAAKSEFLMTMSHELRTPLNGILGMSDILLMDDLSGDQKTFVGDIRTSGLRLLATVNKVLEYTEVSDGRQTAQASTCILREVVQSLQLQFGPLAQAKGLELEMHLQADMPEAIMLDAAKLRRIAEILLENAIEFTRSGRVRLTLELAGMAAAERICLLGVEDTGCGMSEEVLRGLFRPFARGDHSTTRAHGGIGMGLAIARQLADCMGGSIEVSSRPDEGSCFTVRLPVPAMASGTPLAA